jgi:hypothetical protein
MGVDEEGARTPTVPAIASSWVMLHDFGQRALVKMTVPDGTAKTVTTIADVVNDQDGRQVDINAEPLTPAQQTVAKSFLENNGVDTSSFDADKIDDRRKLMKFVLKQEAHFQGLTTRELLDGWDIA